MENEHSFTIQENFTCGRWKLTQEEYDFQALHGFWIESLASVIVGIFGLIVNSITVVILSKKPLNQKLFNKLLICLSVFDILFLANTIYESFRLHMIGESDYCSLEGHVLIVLLPFRKIVMYCSIYMTLVLTLERYLAVARPITHRNRSIGSSDGKRVLKYISPVILLSVAYSAPLAFAFRIQSFAINNSQLTANDALSVNATSAATVLENSTAYCLVPTDMRISKEYILWYGNVANFVVTSAIPFLFLAFFNCKIYLIIQSALKDRQHLEIRPRSSTAIQQKSEDLRQAIVLFGIVIAFFVCHALRMVLNIEEIITYEDWTQTYEKATKLGVDCTGDQFWTMVAADISKETGTRGSVKR